MDKLEIKLNNIISELYEEMKAMHPKDGLKSPRDLKLVSEINKKSAILDKLQDVVISIQKG